MVLTLTSCWLIFSAGVYYFERETETSTITSYLDALYWGIAAFSTAGIADTPKAKMSLIIGGAWIVIGSILFFGTIVATITTYFMRPMQRPHKQIIDTIEFNLEQLDDLTIEELELLKKTTDTLIDSMEQVKRKHKEA